MATSRESAFALGQLFRVKPVVSWGVSACLLGAALAFAQSGTDLNYVDGILGVIAVLLAQGFVSHGLNDAYDWITGTDRESIGKGTGGSRVIPQGKMSVAETLGTALAALAGVLAIGIYLYFQHGTPILVLFFIAVWAPVSYSVPPLKLGYRPFNELVVILPALVGVVVGVELVLTGSWSMAAIAIGWLHAMFCISWFVVSRVPDYVPDKRVGKATTVVFVGRMKAELLSASYLALGLAAAPVLAVSVSYVFLLTPLAWAAMTYGLVVLDPFDEENASFVRLQNMHVTSVHAVVVAIGLVITGV